MSSPPVPYPVNLCLAGRPVLVVGGGPVAARKVDALCRAGARVTVVAPAATGEIAGRADVSWRRRPYRPGEAGSYRLVVTATSDGAVNSQVARDCGEANVFVNSADDPANCTFTLPSVARRGDLQVTVSTGGRTPALARWLRRRIEREIDCSYTTLLELLSEARAEARATFGTSEAAGWEAALDDGLLELARTGRVEEARARLRSHLGLAPVPESHGTHETAAVTIHAGDLTPVPESQQTQEPRRPEDGHRRPRLPHEPQESQNTTRAVMRHPAGTLAP